MGNEEPTRSSDPPPGSTGDLAAGFGASLSRESELADCHVELRRLCGRPC